MLSLFTLKKILFSLTVGGAVVGPVVATSPIIKEFQWSTSSVSPMKEGLTNLQKVDIYEGESISSFLQKALIHTEGQAGLIESFSQELARRWYLSQPGEWINAQIRSWGEQHEKQFKSAWEKMKPTDVQRDFWDNFWGSKESMNSFGLRFKAHELVKSFLTEVKKSDFKLNDKVTNEWSSTSSPNGNLKNYFTGINHFESWDKMKTQSDWSKIGFYPTRVPNPKENWEKVIWGKYDFINWSYKKWFDTKLPIYFWKISWNYDKTSSKDKLKENYNINLLGKEAPSQASYEFPMFSNETKEKFKQFIQHISKNGNSGVANASQTGNGQASTGRQELNLEKYHVPIWLGDKKSNGEVLELFNAFKNSTPEAASALNYLLSKYSSKRADAQVQPNSTTQSQSSINQVSIPSTGSDSTNSYNDPIELFLEKDPGTGDSNKSIEFNSQILKSNNKQWKFSYDVREASNSGWLFFRDDQGVHAIQLDGYKYLQQKQNPKDLFGWFNFRNLQSTWDDRISIPHNNLISSNNDWFTLFSTFLSENFDSLFTQYYSEKGDKSLFFNSLRDKQYFDNYKDLFKSLFSLKREQDLYLYLFDLRKKIIERYSKREWEVTSFLLASNSAKTSKKFGLSSVFPYSVSVESDETRFPDQESILKSFFKKEEGNGTTAKDFSTLLGNYYSSIKELLGKEGINLNTRSNGFNFSNSQRIFIQDPIFDFLLDKLFSQKEFLNYLIKEEKLLGTSFFNQNRIFNSKKDDKSSQWGQILKIQDNTSEITKVDNPATAAQPAVTGTCPYTLESDANQPELEKLFRSIIKSYLFRQHLKNLNNDYFNFWVNFSDFKKKRPNTADVQQVSSQTSEEKLSDFELFELWRRFSLTDIKNKSAFLDFLITLDYLTKSKFQNLREFMNKQLSDSNKYHYLSFEIKESKANTSLIAHPFFPIKTSSGATEKISYLSSRKEMRTLIREDWKPGAEIGKEGVKNGTTPTTTSPKVPVMLHSLKINAISNPDKNKNLFNFENLEELVQYIKNLTSVKELEFLANILSSFNWRIYPSFYRAEKIFFTSSSSSGSKGKVQKLNEEKKLYLEDKKQALIYQILNTNESVYVSKIFTKEEIDKIFKEHTVNATTANTTAPSSSSTSSQQLDKKFFERGEGAHNKEYFIQISKNDFSSEEKMCSLFNKLPVEILSEFIIQQTDDPLNQQNAQDKFFENIPRLKVHDLKFKGHIDSRFRS